jgi:hypothetical protein
VAGYFNDEITMNKCLKKLEDEGKLMLDDEDDSDAKIYLM